MFLNVPFLNQKRGNLSIINKMADTLLKKRFFPREKPQKKLPPQQKERPILLLNPEKILFRKYPSLFDYKIAIRPFSGLFLFDLAHQFEIISYLNATPNEQSFIYERLDPYGCISFRLNSENIDLNRDLDSLVVLETEDDQWDGKYKKNLLKVQEWNGKKDEKLFLLDQFLSNLLYVDRKTWPKTIDSFKDLPFFECYNQVQKRLFASKNFLSRNYSEFMKKVRNDKLNEFNKAKIVMDDQLWKENALSDWITPISGFIRSLLL